MTMNMTQEQLNALITCHGTPRVALPDGTIGIFSSLQREDGSGKRFNLTFTMPESLRIGNSRVPVCRVVFTRIVN